MPKKRLRADALERRAHVSDRHARSARVTSHVLAMEAWTGSRVVAAFASFGSEVDTDALLAAALSDGKTLALPVTDAGKGALTLHRVTDLGTLTRGHYGIREPCHDPIAVESVDVIIVPGVAFDARGHRVGYGRGYFDGLLASMPRALKVGIAFDAQIVPRVPDEIHDVPVDVVVTESGARPSIRDAA